jgi:hypothetical protein
VAVCLLPGTEVAFESEVERDHPFGWLLLFAGGEQASAQSTSAENGFVVSNPFPFTETASGNKDHSAFQFKPSMDHHAVTDPEINDITRSSLITRPIPHGAIGTPPKRFVVIAFDSMDKAKAWSASAAQQEVDAISAKSLTLTAWFSSRSPRT